MDAAEVVVKVVRDVALQGTYGASLEELWRFSQIALSHPLDPLLRGAVWSWIRTHPAIVCTNASGMPLSKEALEKPIQEYGDHEIRVYATEPEQWVALTGRPKEKNPVGPHPFELLCAVSRAREKGLTSVEIHKSTGQDPRSIFGRVQLLESLGLVRKLPVTRDSVHTHLVVFHDYCEDQSFAVEPGTIDKNKESKHLVELAQAQPNHIILYSEAFRKLQFDKFAKGTKYFSKMCRALEAKGCILRVNVYGPSDPSITFKCIKFLKDLDDDVEDVEDDEDGEEIIVPDKEELDLTTAVEVKESIVLFNLFYPLETQIYSLVKSYGTKGISAMDIYRFASGETFMKPLGHVLQMISASEKSTGKQGWIALERGIDFVQRLKYYRYFTRITHALFLKRHIPGPWGSLKELKSSQKTLQDLNIQCSTALMGSCSICVDSRSNILPCFHGENPGGKVIKSSDEAGKKRGRPKKNQTDNSTPLADKVSYKPLKSSLPAISRRKWTGGTPAEPSAPSLQLIPSTYAGSGSSIDNHDDKSDENMEINSTDTNELSQNASSLAMQKRISAFRSILEQNSGVVEGGASLCREIDNILNEGKALDRRTLTKMLNGLEDEKVIKQDTVTAKSALGTSVSRPIIYDSSLTTKSPRFMQVKHQIASRLGARRTLTLSGHELPTEGLTNSRVEELFENLDKPKRLRNLLQAAIKERREQTERDPRPSRAHHGPRASSLVNIPGRSDPNMFATGPSSSQLKRPLPPSRKPYARRTAPPIDDDRFFRTVVISRSLYGKNETTINWNMVAASIPGLVKSNARQKWINIRDNFGGAKAVQRATYQWETLFFKYYTKGEIKLQDPDSLNFDLRHYVEFWRKYHPGNILSQPLWRHNHSRLLSRKDYEQAYGLIKAKPVSNPIDIISTLPSMIKVDEHLSNTSYSFDPLIDDDTVLGEDFTNDEKLVRVIVGIDNDKYDVDAGAARLAEIGEERATDAVNALTESKVIIYIPRNPESVMPGRNFAFSDRMMSALLFKHDPSIFSVAQAWEKEIQDREISRVQLGIQDNQMVSLLELCAVGAVYLDRKNIKTGKLIANYQSRHISRELLDFDLDICSKSPLPDIIPAPWPEEELFVWGRGEGSELWNAFAKKVLTTIQQKPHISLRQLSDCVSFGFDRTEIMAALEWLISSNLVEYKDGYRVKYRWYYGFKQ